MLNTVNTKKLINKRIAISGFVLMAAVFALLPAITAGLNAADWLGCKRQVVVHAAKRDEDRSSSVCGRKARRSRLGNSCHTGRKLSR